MAADAQTGNGIGRYLFIYFCILLIAALQFVVAYSSIDRSQMLVRMLLLACLEALLAILVFMHLWMERRGFLWFVGGFSLFVLAAMQYGWSDSFRLLTFRLSK